MAKDPAVLWYWSDWHSGTGLLSRFLKGCYMDLLHAQFSNGHLSLEEIKIVLGSDFGQSWPAIQKKFKQDPDGLFFNERLECEQLKRQKYCASRSNNKSGRKNSYDKSYDNHMNDHMINHMENENRNRIRIEDKGGVGEKEEREKDPGLFEGPKQILPDQKTTDFELLSAQAMTDRDNFVRIYVQRGITEPDLVKWLANFVSYLKVNACIAKTESEFRRHFGNWLKYQKTINPDEYQEQLIFKDSKNQQNGTKYGSSARDRQTAASAAVSADIENTVRLIKSRPNYTGR